MKMIIAIIVPSKLEELKRIADKYGESGITVSSVMGCGTQKGKLKDFKGIETEINLLPKIKAEIFVKDEEVEQLLLEIQKQISTGNIGDGKVAVLNVEDLMRIRTGERGNSAL
ncbi:MAG: P-II family nitrogen regulator [Bilifractor sp.]